MSTPHIEVVPRIIDSSISATYQKPEPKAADPKPKEEKVVNVAAPIALTFTQKFFRTVKDYTIPILFIILVIVVVYIFWKYFTKYRNQPAITSVIEQPKLTEIAPREDLSKYILDSSSDECEDDCKLSTIEEESENHSEQESEQESGDESENESDNESPPSLITEPDLHTISELINQPIDENDYILEESKRFEYIDESNNKSDDESNNKSDDESNNKSDDESNNKSDDESMFTLPSDLSKTKIRKSRKPKRLVL
jgi:hypothetical protein